MATPYSDVYDVFKNKITDYDILVFTDDEKDEILKRLMVASCVKFKRNCLIDLTDRDEAVGQFNNDLDDEIIEIITTGMIVEWIKPKLLLSESYKNALSTKDLSFFSPANLLKEIRETHDYFKKEYRSMINRYSYDHGDVGSFTL
jgi:hypothetical protein